MLLVERTRRVSAREAEGISEICALCPFDIETHLPGVSSLSLLKSATITESSARALSELKELRIETGAAVNMSWFRANHLRSLAFKDRSLVRYDGISDLPVTSVRIEWMSFSLERLPERTHHLIVNGWKGLPRSDLTALGRMHALQSLTLSGAIVVDSLLPLAEATGLIELSVATRSLDGLADMPGLRAIRLTGSIPSLGPLARLPQLESADLIFRGRPTTLQTMPAIPSLKRLRIDCGDINGFPMLDSFGFVRGLAALEELIITGVSLEHPDIAAIRDLKHLRVLELLGAFGREVDELQDSKGIGSVRITNIGVPSGRDTILSPALVDDRWTLFEDFSGDLGVSNNHQAEEVIRRELDRAAPDIVHRLCFDSEAGMFGASSPERADIERVVTIINRLITKTPNRRP
jgi:hypothetical protein